MKDVEAKYFTFSPYANTVKTVIGPAKVISIIDVDNKKRKLENEKVAKTYLQRNQQFLYVLYAVDHMVVRIVSWKHIPTQIKTVQKLS